VRALLLIIIIWALLSQGICDIPKREANYSDQKICNAIFYVEGGYKANQLYGINPKYSICSNKNSCFDTCIKTVHHWRMVYNNREYLHYKDFLTFLSYKYCPDNWQVWLKNLKFFLGKEK